jgi:ATP-binding cassette subfamily E protein 1
MPRIAIVNHSKCKPTKCSKECIKYCPPQQQGKQVIDIEDLGSSLGKTAKIAESLCIGCNLCVNRCPFSAIKIINIPEELPESIVYEYGPNQFKLYKLPYIKKNMVCGIIGPNGVGKSTILEILCGSIKPNFGSCTNLLNKQIVSKFRGSSLQNYFNDLYSSKLKITVKKQNISELIQTYEPNSQVKNITTWSSENDPLNISSLGEKQLQTLSGGELQRLYVWICASSNSDVYIFDEPSNFLDVKQRVVVSKTIRSLVDTNKYVIVVDHDISMIDYITDEINIIYGTPNAYGVCSNSLTGLAGTNSYLAGYIQSQNIRFRDYEYTFVNPGLDLKENASLLASNVSYSGTIFKYPESDYTLTIPDGQIDTNGTINLILGPNGTGKTTFVNWLCKSLGVTSSYKTQNSSYKSLNPETTVLEHLDEKIKSQLYNPQFVSEVIKPLGIENLYKSKLVNLSGGEAQRVSIVECLGTPASVYFIDEPSANLDIEKRLKITGVIKKYIINNSKCAFIVEHDIMMGLNFVQDVKNTVIICSQSESNTSHISTPLPWSQGINSFLQMMGITMRSSEQTARPRINKLGSQMDQEQKKLGLYYK